MTYDPTKTLLDAEPPRFDVKGNLVTGEFDMITTPEIELIELVDVTEIRESNDFWKYFAIGAMIGAVLFLGVIVLKLIS